MKIFRYGKKLSKFWFHPSPFSEKKEGNYLTFLKKGEGFTSIEVVIVVIIFALIITVVYSVYNLSSRAYLEGENVAEITQNGRVILERISREIRQAREIVTELPEERINPPAEIQFQDGHLSLVSEEDTAQGGSINTITLASTSSDENDYYKDMFVKITGGAGAGQIKKIVSYNGGTQTAEVEDNWGTNPESGSTYKIDSFYYYIHYDRDADNNIWRKVVTYCFAEVGFSVCIQPEIYMPWNATPPAGQELLKIILEEPRLIGEYVADLEFWGSRVINIYLTLERKNKSIDFQTKIFGRNL